MNYLVFTQKGNKDPVLIARTKYQRDAQQLLMSYTKGFVLDKNHDTVFKKGME